jgi:hypothetical protein
MKRTKYLCLHLPLIFATVLFSLAAAAQSGKDAAQSIITKIDTFNSKMPVEKLYIQTDKPYYAVGDTIWFKAYLCNASLSYSPLSSRLYVELLNDSGRVVQRMAAPMALGISWGDIDLSSFREGSYTLRAYTNWMRNFNNDYFFQKAFYIGNPQKQKWIATEHSVLSAASPNTIKLEVQLSQIDSQPDPARELKLRLLDGKRIINTGSARTGISGEFNTQFNLPDQKVVKSLSLQVADASDPSQKINIPLTISRLSDIDLQFMPEGGYMVAGLPSHIGFKAVGEDGRGIDVSGKIINLKNNQEVADLQSVYKGLGTIDLAPEIGDIYVARLSSGGVTRDIKLPAIKTSGSTISASNLLTRDTMNVRIFLSPDQLQPDKNLYLVGQSRGIICFAVPISGGKTYTSLRVPKSNFPTGIAHLTLLNPDYKPLNERLVYIDHKDNLKIDVSGNSQRYMPHDSIPIHINVQTVKGEPVVGSFSVAVTDDYQVKADSVDEDNILSHLLIASDLKGNVESVGHYLLNDPDNLRDLDCLLLTQGWVGYDWPAIVQGPQNPVFPAEYQYMVSGKVSNLVGKPIANADVLLLATGKYKFVKDTTTNGEGRFTFKNFALVDSVTFVLEARNAKRKVISAGINIDEKQGPGVNLQNLPRAMPWNVNSSAQMLNYIKTDSGYRTQLEYAQYGVTGRMLNTVTIRDKAIIRGSQNLNGPGESDQTIDEEALEKADKMSLTQLLLQKVTGFRIGFKAKSTERNFFLKDKSVHFVIDGIDINQFFEVIDGGPPEQLYNYDKQYLDYFTAEDIKGIEVFYSIKYTNNYNNKNLTTDELQAEAPTGSGGLTTATIEITTRSGNGPFTEHANGIFVYKPMFVTHAKDFYRPRYQKGETPKFGDLRSTIHWQPSVVTAKDGTANISFYAADKPTTYTIIIQGTDFKGDIGYKTVKVTISK